METSGCGESIFLTTVFASTAASCFSSSFSICPSFVSDALTPSVGDLIITEVCGDGAGGGSDDGFMEIYNTSSNTFV